MLTRLFNKKRKRAVFTMVRDESVFLPIWLRYYSQFFDSKDIYVMNHLSADNSIKHAKRNFRFNLINVKHPVYNDFIWYTATVMAKQRELLQRYETVLYCESDEIVYHKNGLDRYISELQHPAVRTNGYLIWHDRNEEPTIDLTRPILSQRKYWLSDTWSCKPILSRVPLTYEQGFHNAKEESYQDKDLLLFHLHTFDFETALAKHQRTRSYQDYSKESIEKNAGFQARLIGEEFVKWFDSWIEESPKERIHDDLVKAMPI